MTRQRNVPLLTAIAATVAVLALLAVHLWVSALPGMDKLEGFSVDARFKMRGPRAPSTDRIVIVGLDDETHRRHPEVFQTRRGYAALIDALTKYNAKVIALDLFFSSPEIFLPSDIEADVRATASDVQANPPADPTAAKLALLVGKINEQLRGDELLTAAITSSKRVFLGAHFFGGPGASAPEPGKLALARHGEAADSGRGGQRRPIHAYAVDFTMDTIGAGAIGAGAVNNFRDKDGIVRRMPLSVEYGGRQYMSLGLAVALYDLGKPGDTRYLVGNDTLRAGGHELPVGDAASLTLDMLGKRKFTRISAADVVDGKVAPEALANKIVYVGFTLSSFDKVQTPLDNLADGVELHATLTENILGNRLMRVAGPLAAILATLALSVIVILLQLRRVRRRAWVPPLASLLAFAAYVVVAQLVFSGGLIIQVATPIVMASFVLIAATVGGLATEGREKAHLRAVFSQYVSRTVVDKVLADPSRMKLGGERKELTVLFSDIRGFSAFAEGMGPETLASFLGEYLTPMTDLVLESGGTLDKYIGDAVMAIWAAPVDLPDHAARACEVALKMQEALIALNKKWKTEGKPEVAIGIGINTGAMSVGNMGTPARFDYT
ncbi:MAG TPA: adenylate/guanylate cyclase domain-containing protein, partial [Kofleriaceae bacterium]|nr:adenylate/guanylate cyclase domain-containing protein [Kofleriaceae bacterium]